ncbi:MAG: hypothetical protein KJO98_05660 [Rhodothermia bacterium]|nr:hypothetical protein [Rhodothermia bacterium]
MTLSRARIRELLQSKPGRLAVKTIRVVFVVGVLALLFFQLSSIGWEETWKALPTTPWFYVTLLAIYVQLPIVEMFIYRGLWKERPAGLLGVLFRKRVLNADVVGYSGEIYLYMWSRERVGVGESMLLHSVKDNAVASSIASTSMAVLLLAVFLYTDQIAFLELIGNPRPVYLLGGLAVLAVVFLVIYRFRRTLFGMPAKVVGYLIVTHSVRLSVVHVLQVLQWWVVWPEAPLKVWATMLVIATITNRLPLLPAKDLIGVSAILGTVGMLNIPEPVVAGMLLSRSVIDKILNLIVFGASYLTDEPVKKRGGEHETLRSSTPHPETEPKTVVR